MLKSITVNSQQAAASEGPNRITETGMYVGRVVQCDQFDTKKGATMIRLYFEAETGATAWITTCVVKNDGEPSFGMGLFQALVSNVGLTTIDFSAGRVRSPKGDIIDGLRSKTLEGKRVGVILRQEPREYRTESGEIRIAKDVTLAGSFEAATGLTYSERASQKTEAKAAAARLAYLIEHPVALRKLEGAASAASTQATTASAVDALDEDTPF